MFYPQECICVSETVTVDQIFEAASRGTLPGMGLSLGNMGENGPVTQIEKFYSIAGQWPPPRRFGFGGEHPYVVQNPVTKHYYHLRRIPWMNGTKVVLSFA